MTRIERLAGGLAEPLLVTAPTNVRYLTGLVSTNAAVLSGAGETTLYTDFRYAESARDVAGVTFVETRRDLIGDLAERLTGRRIGFEANHLSHTDYTRLRTAGVELVATTGLVEALRAVKEAAELEALRKAAATSDRVFAALSDERLTGRTEREVAWWVERSMRELGATALSFPVVVAAAENGARPHARPRDEPIPAGTLVTVDAGCVVDGYCSDCTRTFATGDLPEPLAEAYALCLRAQRDALAAIRAGTRLREADAASRVAIGEAGLGDRYGHGLGHGVGLEVHEAPSLRPEAPADAVLQVGNAVTVEPGIYLPGEGGVRIEDLVVVTTDGYESLTRAPKELLVVG